LGRKTGICEESTSDLAALLEELKRGDLPPDLFRRRLRSLLDHRAQAIPLLLRTRDPSLIAASIDLQEVLEGPRATEAPG